METEKQIVYSIINTIRNHSHNNDEDVSERLIRSHILSYRADSIRKHYKDGHTVEDQVFQRVPIKFTGLSKNPISNKPNKEFIGLFPKLIRLSNHYGMKLERIGITIPVLDSELYNLTKKNHLNQNHVFAKTDTRNACIFIGNYSNNCASSDSEIKILIDEILQDIERQFSEDINPVILDFDLYTILYNPSDDPTYDWENDIFPFPAERNPELKMQILKNEFGIIVDLRAKKDEVQNTRPDNIRYHEEQNIQE